MRFFRAIIFLLVGGIARLVPAQSGSPSSDTVRVTVSLNADGSRTTYRADDANHKAVATTTNLEGKVLSRTHYKLDDNGRFATGAVYGPDKKLRFKSTYSYDNSGKLIQELQSDKTGTLLHKIVYSYDSLGKQIGYSIYDGTGKMVNQATAPSVTASPEKKKSR